MRFQSLDEIKQSGFTGFHTLRSLTADPAILPDVCGVYMILNTSETRPVFLAAGTGGFFKGKNPNITLAKLEDKWVEQTIVLYIGKAGGSGSRATLRSRLIQYLDFGQGKAAAHWGGRLIWQLENAAELLLCWKPLTTEEPRMVERELILQFVAEYGKRPFANLKG